MDLIEQRNYNGGKARPRVMGGFKTEDYYRYYRNNKGALKLSAFRRIIRAANKALVEEVLANAESYTLPYGIGTIDFRKSKNRAFMTKDGVKSSSPVDWKKTMELWVEDSQAHRNKIKVKYSNMHTARYSFSVRCFNKRFKNHEYFKMTFKRSFKRALAERIMSYQGRSIDASINERNLASLLEAKLKK